MSRRSLSRRGLIALPAVAICALLLGGNAARATSYPPVTFDELVTEADVIFIGEVTDVRPFPLDTRDGTIIKTRVIFRVSGESGRRACCAFGPSRPVRGL